MSCVTSGLQANRFAGIRNYNCMAYQSLPTVVAYQLPRVSPWGPHQLEPGTKRVIARDNC